ncbi:MAG: hypothetical protein WAM11_04255 [Cyanobium sp.]
MSERGVFRSMLRNHEEKKKILQMEGQDREVDRDEGGEAPRFRAEVEEVRAGTVSGLQEQIDQITKSGRSEERSLFDRMRKKFGLGGDPRKRTMFYKRVQALYEERGPVVMACVQEAAAQAVSANRPGNYFCKALAAKLREAGLILGASGDGGQIL